MADIGIADAGLDLGRVVRDTFAVVRRRAAQLFGVTLALYLLPLIATGYYAQGMIAAAGRNDPATRLGLFASPVYWGLLLVSTLLGSFAYAFQLKIAIGDLEGDPPNLDEAVLAGLKRLLPVLAASLLLGVGIGLGMVFLIVPGIILAMTWSVTLPSIVDRGGVFAGFSHSRDLTRGNRWRIFGLALVFGIVAVAIQAVLSVAVGGGTAATRMGAGSSVFGLVVISIYSWIISVLTTVGLASLYAQLWELKTGGGEGAAQVFA